MSIELEEQLRESSILVLSTVSEDLICMLFHVVTYPRAWHQYNHLSAERDVSVGDSGECDEGRKDDLLYVVVYDEQPPQCCPSLSRVSQRGAEYRLLVPGPGEERHPGLEEARLGVHQQLPQPTVCWCILIVHRLPPYSHSRPRTGFLYSSNGIRWVGNIVWCPAGALPPASTPSAITVRLDGNCVPPGSRW
jgi:hypothetical protein